MDNILSYSVQFLTLVVSIIAIVIAYKTFVRQNTFENENHIFKYKIDKYNEILSCLIENITFLKKQITDYYSNYSNEEEKQKYLEDIQDIVSDKIEETELLLVSKLVFVSEKIIDKIELYNDFSFKSNFINSNYEVNYDEIEFNKNRKKDFDNVYKLEDIIYTVADVMRTDSGVDPLSKKLHARINTEKKQKHY